MRQESEDYLSPVVCIRQIPDTLQSEGYFGKTTCFAMTKRNVHGQQFCAGLCGQNGSIHPQDPGFYPATGRFAGGTSGDGARKSGITDRRICSGWRRSAVEKFCLHLHQASMCPLREILCRNPIPPFIQNVPFPAIIPCRKIFPEMQKPCWFFRKPCRSRRIPGIFRSFPAVAERENLQTGVFHHRCWNGAIP